MFKQGNHPPKCFLHVEPVRPDRRFDGGEIRRHELMLETIITLNAQQPRMIRLKNRPGVGIQRMQFECAMFRTWQPIHTASVRREAFRFRQTARARRYFFAFADAERSRELQ